MGLFAGALSAGLLLALKKTVGIRVSVDDESPVSAAVFDAVAHWGLKTRHLPELRFVNRYHDDPGYIDALAPAPGPVQEPEPSSHKPPVAP